MRIVAIIALVFSGVAMAAPARRPAELDALLARVRIAATVMAWCAGEFESGRRAYAVAVPAPGGGRYLVIGMGETPVLLASFTGGAELACYSAAEAKAQDRTIAKSETIHGAIAPRWNTTVVCGFVENTSAACWQYSPKARAFVKVGGWTT